MKGTMKRLGVKKGMILVLFLFLLVGGLAWAGPQKGSVQKPPPKRVLPPAARGLESRFSDLSIEDIYLIGCCIGVVIKNLGPGGLHSEDRQRGNWHWSFPAFPPPSALKMWTPTGPSSPGRGDRCALTRSSFVAGG